MCVEGRESYSFQPRTSVWRSVHLFENVWRSIRERPRKTAKTPRTKRRLATARKIIAKTASHCNVLYVFVTQLVIYCCCENQIGIKNPFSPTHRAVSILYTFNNIYAVDCLIIIFHITPRAVKSIRNLKTNKYLLKLTHTINYYLYKLTRALEFPSQFVGSLVTVGLTVAQPRKLVQLQNRGGLVHLTSEVSVFQVQKEYLSFYAESDSALSVYLDANNLQNEYRYKP